MKIGAISSEYAIRKFLHGKNVNSRKDDAAVYELAGGDGPYFFETLEEACGYLCLLGHYLPRRTIKVKSIVGCGEYEISFVDGVENVSVFKLT